MLRSRGNRLPSERAQLALLSFSFSRSGRRACRLSLYRGGRAAPVSSPSVVFGRHAASRSIARRLGTERTSPILPLPPLPPLPPLLSSSLLSSRLVIPRVREEKDRARMRFPSSSSPSLSGDILAGSSLSSCGFLLRLPRPRVALVVSDRRYRCTRIRTYIHTPYPPRRIVPAENRAFFRACPAAIPRRFHSDPP